MATSTAIGTVQTSNSLTDRHKIVEIPIIADFDNTEQFSGWSFPSKCVVLGAWVDVTTIDAGETLNVGTDGTSNDPDGFLAAVSIATAGVVKGTLISSGQTVGALLRVDESGGGVLVPEGSVACGGDEVTFTGSATTCTARGSIFISYYDLS